MADARDMRTEYHPPVGLSQHAAGDDPITALARWLDESARAGEGCGEPNAMALATVDASGHPNVRMVLCKGIDGPAAALRFFTNLESPKAAELAGNAHATALFWWPSTHRQVRIRGTVQQLGDEEVADYFATRPRGAQIGAHASRQSRAIGSRQELDLQAQQVRELFADPTDPVPVPDAWGGFRIVALEVEFWQGREDRLHDRVCFVRCAEEYAASPPGSWGAAVSRVTDQHGRSWWRARLQP